MFWRDRKVQQDREAGMVFDWRRGHGSTYRLFLAVLVSASFWGGMLAFVKVKEPSPIPPKEGQIDLTVRNLDEEENRWLAELIDRKTLFQQRWEVTNHEVVDQTIAEKLMATTPRIYEPTLREIPLPELEGKLLNLPGRGANALPEPEQVASVKFVNEPVNWWIEVKVVEGPDGLEAFEFPFEWPDNPGLMSEGEFWSLVVTADWAGRVVAVEGWWEQADDVRTGAILNKVQSRPIEALSEKSGLRVWRLEARVVNRPSSE